MSLQGPDGGSLAPADLVGCWDDPGEGAPVPRPGPVVVRGWHLWRGRPAIAVAVQVDGVATVAGAVGAEPRPDVAAVLDDDSLAGCGWQVLVDLPEPPDATEPEDTAVTVSVTVWGALDAPPVSLGRRTFRLYEPPPPEAGPERPEPDPPEPEPAEPEPAEEPTPSAPILGSLEYPEEGDLAEGPNLVVSGWAIGEAGPVSRVEVLLDGRDVGRAVLGLPRTDVAEQFEVAHALLSGFQLVLDLAALPPSRERARVTVLATTSDAGPVTLGEREVRIEPVAGRPAGATTSGPRRRRRAAPAGAPTPGAGRLDLAVFAHDLDLGGAQLWLTELLRRSGAGRQFGCTVVSPRDGVLRPALEALGVDLHLTRQYDPEGIESCEGWIDELAAWLAAGGYNAVLVNTVLPWVGAAAARRVGLPVVWSVHESYPATGVLDRLLPGGVDAEVRAAFLRTLGQAQATVFVAEATRQLYASAAGPERSVVVRYGVDLAAVGTYCEKVGVADARRGLGLAPDARVLLVVGLVQPTKAQTLMALAFAEVADRFPGSQLIMLGDTLTPYAARLREYVSRVGLGGRILLEPIVADTFPWYRSADVLVSGSYTESLPRNILEALAFGVPVVATSVFGVPEVLTDGVTAHLFEAGDLDAAVAAMIRVLEADAAELRRIADAGRRLAWESYDSSGYARDIVALLEGLRADAGASPAELLRRARESA